MTSFPLVPLTSLCEVLSGGTPKTTNGDFWNGDISWASVKDFNTPSRWFSSTEKSITKLGLENCSTSLLEPGDLILSARGTVGVVAQCSVQTAFNQSNYGLKAKPGKAINDFLYYALLAANRTILAETHGGAFDTITRATLDRIMVPAPQLQTQVLISKTLGLLDEKIELNSILSKELEQLAQTIFKSWFIDFDPVHAKARGEQTEGMDAETAALFPYSFDETELGLIPSGWGVSRFDSFAEIQLGGTPSKARAEYWDGSIPWINSGAINEFRITKPSRYITELGLRKSSCKVLPKGTTVVAITGATLGQFSRVEIDTTANQSVIGIAPRNRCLNNFVYLWMTQNIEQLTSKATGGAQQHINRNDVCEQSVVLPSHEATSKFDELVDPIFAIISSLVHQNDTLVEIRDSLLPRIISGELEIPEDLLVD